VTEQIKHAGENRDNSSRSGIRAHLDAARGTCGQPKAFTAHCEGVARACVVAHHHLNKQQHNTPVSTGSRCLFSSNNDNKQKVKQRENTQKTKQATNVRATYRPIFEQHVELHVLTATLLAHNLFVSCD
jgi:hypothetical protein